MFEVEMLPAREGDCLWIRYGATREPKQILIDGGRAATFSAVKSRLSQLPAKRRKFELLIVTHVDRDHIEGVLKMLSDTSLKLKFADIWFNGYDHLNLAKVETFGAMQGERLSALLTDNRQPWNKAWNGMAVCLTSQRMRHKTLAGGLKLTLVSPDANKLTKLLPVWESECRKAGLVAGIGSKPAETRGLESFGAIDIEALAASRFKEDTGPANGSSIGVLAQYRGQKVLLTGDAHTDRLCESIRKLKRSSKRLKLDAMKLAHHGSDHNISKQLLGMVDCKRFLVSTNGAYFKHPTQIAMARLIKFQGNGATIFFNYRSKHTTVWNNATWKSRYGYETQYPSRNNNGSLTVTL